MQEIVIGVDIGGSHVSAAAIDIRKNEIIEGSIKNCKVDNKAHAEEILTSWVKTISDSIETAGKSKLLGIGFAMPSPFDYVNGVALFERVEKFESLHGINIRNEILNKLDLSEEVPVRFINDATSFAIGEAWLGKGYTSEKIVAITLGTGFGSAFIEKGVPVLDGSNVPEFGCLWHLPFKDGIADDYFSTRWFVNSFYRKTNISVKGVKEIVDLSQYVDEAQDLFCEFGTNLGKFIAPWLKKFDAEMLIMGGNITGAYPLFGNYLVSELIKEKPNFKIELSDLKENAALIGSARLLNRDYWKNIEQLLQKM